MFTNPLIRWALVGAVILSLIAAIYIMSIQSDLERTKTKLDTATEANQSYQKALEFYVNQGAAQEKELAAEHEKELSRNQRAFKTLNLIGDINEKDNYSVTDGDNTIFDSLYGVDNKERAAGRKP